MIFLITGANGGGKSHYSVNLIKQQLDKNKDPSALNYDEWIKQYLVDGDGYLEPIVDNPKPLIRPIFSNIKGLKFDTDQLFTIEKDFDWRKYPFGSMIFLDECHQHWEGTGKPGKANNPIIDELDMHRHQGLDFYLITQYPSKLHHVARNLVSQHIHLQNIAGSQRASKFTWMHPVSDPNDYNTRQGADKTTYHYDPKIFQHYKSSSIHTRKFKMPSMGWFLIGLFGVLISLFIFNLSRSIASDSPEPINTAMNAAGEFAEPPAVLIQSPVLVGCISNNFDCICYDEEYRPVQLDFATCKNTMETPLRTVPKISKN